MAYIEIAKEIPALYPDLIEQGGLANAVQAALRSINSELPVSVSPGFEALVHVRVGSGPRFSQVHIGAQIRMFSFDFWNQGVYLAHGATPEIVLMARSIDTWIASGCRTGELANAFDFVAVEAEAAAYERGEEVEMRWREYLATIGDWHPELVAFVAAAAAAPKLQQLFPYTSIGRFCFSRCTGFPFTEDTPHVVALGGDRYEVRDRSGKRLGRGTAAEAVAIAVAALPPNCGPAVAGTADDLAEG